MKKIFLFLILLIIPFMINGKELELEWQKSFGGSSIDLPTNFVYVSEGDYYIATVRVISSEFEGLKTNEGTNFLNPDVVILKLDNNGNIISKNLWGGNGNDYLKITSMNTRGEFILFGGSNSSNIEGFTSNGGMDFIYYKYNKDGTLLWQKSYGGNGNDVLEEVILLDDGSFLAVGNTNSTDIDGITHKGNSDAFLIRFDENGNVVWKRNWGGSQYDSFYNIVVDSNGSFILSGITRSSDINNFVNNGNYDNMIVKYDKNGNIEWQKSFGGSDKDDDSILLNTYDGFIAFLYYTSSDIVGFPNNGLADYALIKYDYDGNVIWEKSFGGNDYDYFSSCINDIDGNIYVVGNTLSTNLDNIDVNGGDGILLKFDKNGNLLWQKGWGGNNSDAFYRIAESNNGDLMIYASSSSSDIVGLENKGEHDVVFLKYSYKYNLNVVDTSGGKAIAVQKSNLGIITPTPNDGYDVDKIIVRDLNGNVLDVEVTKMEDGTYSFPLSDDVEIEVLFLSNPKTGVIDNTIYFVIMFIISLIGYLYIRKINFEI